MKLLDDLQREHELIEQVLGALRGYTARLVHRQAELQDGFLFVEFLETYAGRWHHQREEGVLFPALRDHALLPADRGPIAVLLNDHAAGASALRSMRQSLDDANLGEFERVAVDYSRALWAHIDAENSVLFPESEQQLRRNQIVELPCGEIPDDVAAVAARGAELISRYGTAAAEDAVRGEGCVMCPAYGDTCGGVEREWWNEWQWEELDEHIAGS